MTNKFMEKILANHRKNRTTRHGKYEYSIEYNSLCVIHTWIIRRKGTSLWEWVQPLPEYIK